MPERVTQVDVLEKIQEQLQEMSKSNIEAFEQIDERLKVLEQTGTWEAQKAMAPTISPILARLDKLEAQKAPKFVFVNGEWIQDRRSGSDRRKS